MKFSNTLKAIEEYSRNVLKSARKILKTPNALGLKKGRVKSNTGKLENSLGFNIRSSKTGITTSFISSAPYAAIVEEGRDKGSRMPPTKPIDRWVIQRSIKGSRNEKGQFTKRKSLVFLIRRKIQRDGIPKFPFMGTAMNNEFEKLPPELQTAVVMDMEDLIFDSFQKSKFVEVKKIV